MKKIGYLLLVFVIIGFSAGAQQKLNGKGMSYVIMTKPNVIIYNDTLYNGSKQFSQLFYRTGNTELLYLYQKHQSNKIVGQILSVSGLLCTVIGISYLSAPDKKGLGWALLGGGFATTLTGGYLTLMGQRNLQMAVSLFNQKYNGASLGIGVSNSSAGLVYQF